MPTDRAIRFSRLRIEGWRQFGRIDVELHPKLTVITGANGSGKSTLLSLFASHFGYSRPFLGTPSRDAAGRHQYLTGIIAFFRSIFPQTRTAGQQVGELAYGNGVHAVAQVPEAGNVQYALVFSPQQPVLGFHVSSHRKLPTYKAVGQIPTQPMILENAYNQFNAEMVHHYQGSNSQFSSTYRLKEALISMNSPAPPFRSGSRSARSE